MKNGDGFFRGVLAAIRSTTKSILSACRRFPLVAVGSVGAFVFFNIYVWGSRGSSYSSCSFFLSCALVSGLLALFSISVRLFFERTFSVGRAYYAALIVCVNLCVVYALYLKAHMDGYPVVEFIRYAALVFAFLSLVFFIPFVRGSKNGMKEYAVILFVRLAVTGLFAFVIFGGISILFAITGLLMNFSFQREVYISLASAVGLIFAPAYFIGGIPSFFKDDFELVYSRPLMILAGYILLPLLAAYMCVIYIYFAKAIILRVWPEGTAANLILIFSTAGIFLLYALSPFESKKRNWISKYSSAFYFSILPLLPLLFICIAKRVYDYGVTESRYFVILIAFWLLAVVFFRTVLRRQVYFFIPASLFICAIFSVFGPWSAFTVSKYSQIYQLKKIMVKENFFDGHYVTGKVSGASQQLVDIVRYLRNTHGDESLKGFRMKGDLQISGAEIFEQMSYKIINRNIKRCYYYSDNEKPSAFDVSGYRHMLRIPGIPLREKMLFPDGSALNINSLGQLQFIIGDKTELVNLRDVFSSMKIVRRSDSQSHLSADGLKYSGETSSFKYMMLFSRISLTKEKGELISADDASFLLFFSRK